MNTEDTANRDRFDHTERMAVDPGPVGHIAYRIDDDLHRRAKVAAARSGLTLKQWLERAIDLQAEAEEAEELRRRR